MSRPEHDAPPEIFYGDDEARKYTSNSRMIEIQTQMSERALELLNLEFEGGSKMVLDIGCGSGLSGDEISRQGHYWVGLDISKSMLDVATEREVEGDLFLADMGDGMFFRAGMFDGAISVSALQWLCNADKSWHNPRTRLKKFFESLFAVLAKGARAVFQFYPENPAQMEMITSAAMRCGFTGGLVVDYPESTRAKKYFLVLFAGAPPEGYETPKAKGEESMEEDGGQTVGYSKERKSHDKKKGKRSSVKDRDWVIKKKESQRKKGKDVRPDTKYTARKRSGPKI
ncbi:hypothetical protein PROFUN_06197 [Planoprotostelium fungivorum]|uniref:Uncharacterized protein n=1 Tax=Planoprotostelium fungivorum TaxID=1890364 RepID=A0A2P6MYZ3_9EUKA|nr:hypothetical protein PROFUN_06197 [Planoprotostelium fungivorum]